MSNRSYRADGKEEIVLKVECGSKPAFSTSGWMATSTYQVTVTEEDLFQEVINQILAKAPNARADEIFGVDKRTSAVIKFDPQKTVRENGITPTSHPFLRFPSKFA